MRKSLFALVLAAQAAAHAQEPGDGQAQRVEVIGSRITRVDGETSLPVQIIQRKEIDESGVQTTEDLLGRLTGNSTSTREALSVGTNATPGLSAASLRGLGATATLVLLNGRRLANYAATDNGAAVDLHAIPLAAIQRVEILKDGASALYGSDAIAGVINFVTRDDFQDGELTLNAGTTQGGGAARKREVLAFGHGDPARDGYNLFGVVDHQQVNALAARQRSFSASSVHPQDGSDYTSSTSFPSNIPLGNGLFANDAAPACTAFTVYKSGGCNYNPARQIDDLPPSNQTTALGRATMRIAPDVDAYAEALYETDRLVYRIAPAPVSAISTGGIVDIDIPTSSPFYPQGLGLTGDLTNVHYRTVSLGPRTSASDSVNERAVAGLRGTWLGWDFDGGASLSESHVAYSLLSGNVSSTALESAFATGQIDPFADSGPAGDALLASTQVTGEARSSQGITRMVDFHASKEVLRLPAGPLALALGGEWRRETLRDDEAALSGDIAGGIFNPPKSGGRSVQALFVELDATLLKGLEAQVALRRDRYSDFGDTVNPKASLAWRPVPAVLLRASGGTGFRAPTLSELYTAQSASLADLDGPDPVRCPVTHLDSDCDLVFLNGTGGNPALKPMHSNQFGAGMVLEPAHDLDISVDYWRIRLRDNITGLDPGDIVNDQAAFAGYITRGPVDPAFPGLPGPILRVDTYNLNLSRLVTSGYDVGAGYRSAPSALGRFSARLDGTFIASAQAITYLGVRHSPLGAYRNGLVIPRWHHELTSGWERGPWTLTLSQGFSSSYVDVNPTSDGAARRVGSTSVFDAQVACDFSKRLTLRLGARNLFDRNPPYSNQNTNAQPGYEPSIDDPRGRFVYATLTARFR